MLNLQVLLGVVTLIAVGVEGNHRCRAEGYFGPTAAGEPCFDTQPDEALRCDYLYCGFFPAYNIWVKYPYICPGTAAATFNPLTGQCGEPPVVPPTNWDLRLASELQFVLIQRKHYLINMPVNVLLSLLFVFYFTNNWLNKI